VDHPLRAPDLRSADALVRPWRTAAYIAGAVAVVELLLLLVVGGGRLAGLVSDRVQAAAKESVSTAPAQPARTTGPARKTQAHQPARPRSKTVVMVLNGNGRTGAAAAAAGHVRGRGYRLGVVGNAPHPAPNTIVMYRPGFAAEGRRLGRDLGVRLVGPLDGVRARDLGAAQLVLILGP